MTRAPLSGSACTTGSASSNRHVGRRAANLVDMSSVEISSDATGARISEAYRERTALPEKEDPGAGLSRRNRSRAEPRSSFPDAVEAAGAEGGGSERTVGSATSRTGSVNWDSWGSVGANSADPLGSSGVCCTARCTVTKVAITAATIGGRASHESTAMPPGIPGTGSVSRPFRKPNRKTTAPPPKAVRAVATCHWCGRCGLR